MAGHVVEFLAPPPFVGGSMLQFWVRGGDVSLENAARAFLETYFDDRRLFSIKHGVVGGCVFGHMWNRSDTFNLHGSAA
jgi:hypothetical protein